MKYYKISAEYYDNWGCTDDDCIVSMDDILMIARGWEINPEDLMDQLVELPTVPKSAPV